MVQMYGIYTSHGRLSLLCPLTGLRVSYAFSTSRTKRVIYAFLYIWFPRRLRNAFREACPVALCHLSATGRRQAGLSAWFAVQRYGFSVYLAKNQEKRLESL